MHTRAASRGVRLCVAEVKPQHLVLVEHRAVQAALGVHRDPNGPAPFGQHHWEGAGHGSLQQQPRSSGGVLGQVPEEAVGQREGGVVGGGALLLSALGRLQ